MYVFSDVSITSHSDRKQIVFVHVFAMYFMCQLDRSLQVAVILNDQLLQRRPIEVTKGRQKSLRGHKLLS